MAASPEQAFKIVIRDPQNNHYDKFGLIGRDGNIHTWDYRPGTPRKRPRVNAMAMALQQAQDVQARKRAPVVVTKEDDEPSTSGPVIASSKELTDVVLKHVLPQISPKRPFKTEEIGRLLPVQYAQAWTRSQNVRSAVLQKLREAGVITKYSFFEYMRAPEFVDKKLIEEAPPPPPPPKTANGNGHAPEPVPVAPPPIPSPEVRATAPPLSADDQVEAVLLMIRAVLSDRSQYKAEVDALSEELINVMTQLDGIRGKLDALIKREQKAPMLFGDLLDSLRRTSPLPPQSAQPAAVVLS
jgi:hypothetical protein